MAAESYTFKKVSGQIWKLDGQYIKLCDSIDKILANNNLATVYANGAWDPATTKECLIFDSGAELELEIQINSSTVRALNVPWPFGIQVLTISSGTPRIIRRSDVDLTDTLGDLSTAGAPAQTDEVLLCGDYLYLPINSLVKIKIANPGGERRGGTRRDEMPGLEEGVNQVNVFGNGKIIPPEMPGLEEGVNQVNVFRGDGIPMRQDREPVLTRSRRWG